MSAHLSQSSCLSPLWVFSQIDGLFFFLPTSTRFHFGSSKWQLPLSFPFYSLWLALSQSQVTLCLVAFNTRAVTAPPNEAAVLAGLACSNTLWQFVFFPSTESCHFGLSGVLFFISYFRPAEMLFLSTVCSLCKTSSPTYFFYVVFVSYLLGWLVSCLYLLCPFSTNPEGTQCLKTSAVMH